MAIDYEALGKRISNARKQVGITQEALGEQLSMTRKLSALLKRQSAVQASTH
ncbi:hypothetical protein HFM85_13370 [Blautia schinkii]|uniref:hypothetical protein n=1 Tax=Blautia schinkii TaxID=180164 RepID=UPI00156E1C91|nr:hypothetical protein [Blautia schinkii]NSG83335.1 hypothetical protein [Blautia schinkii]NSK23941.1 hypothetical protein [Blautia schinkii]NSK26978.1 hypothetical protein [Blautia schinkii]NSK33246.1 hypothetical protein [Blautia schinkii]NSK49770.1 hypothetical protein [Blautia schinkii]